MCARPLAFLLLAAGCAGPVQPPPGADDDDVTFDDDDDSAGDDDDATGTDDGPSYVTEEAFFGLSVGARWRYLEVVHQDITPEEDDVLVEVRNKIPASTLDPEWPAEMAAWEVKLDRLTGQDVTHWYGLDGTGVIRWLHTTLHTDFFETEEFPGDGTVLMFVGPDEDSLLGSAYEGALYLADIEGADYSSSADTIETFVYSGGTREVETLGIQVFEDGDLVGLQYFEPGWGLVGQSVEVGGALLEWTILECSACPPEAGL